MFTSTDILSPNLLELLTENEFLFRDEFGVTSLLSKLVAEKRVFEFSFAVETEIVLV